MTIASRIRAAERKLQMGDPRDCEGGATVILTCCPGESEPPIPADAARCRRCGGVHALHIVEFLVTTTDDDDASQERTP